MAGFSSLCEKLFCFLKFSAFVPSRLVAKKQFCVISRLTIRAGALGQLLNRSSSVWLWTEFSERSQKKT
jgi:hypothetical protein